MILRKITSVEKIKLVLGELLSFFKSPIFTEYFYDVIVAGTRKRGILSAETLVDWYQNLEEKSWGECELFWKACSFEAWSQMFIDGRNYIEIG